MGRESVCTEGLMTQERDQSVMVLSLKMASIKVRPEETVRDGRDCFRLVFPA